jgi:hypothetical protein
LAKLIYILKSNPKTFITMKAKLITLLFSPAVASIRYFNASASVTLVPTNQLGELEFGLMALGHNLRKKIAA